MSLYATSTASRHLSRRILSNANISTSYNLRIGGGNNLPATTQRHFAQSGSNGSGIRRTQNKGRHATISKPKTPKPKETAPSSSSGGFSGSYENADPHLVANEIVMRAVVDGRTPGTESVATLTKEQKLSNYAMATGLLGFVSYVFYYSLASVGGETSAKALIFGDNMQQQQEGNAEQTNPGFEEFLKEANEGRSIEEKRLNAEEEARGEALELAELESSTSARLEAEGVGESVVVGSATEEEEREMARTAGFVEGEDGQTGTKKRPLWKRVVFFWRRE
mmetsp:Transcript_4724/g.7599  ORF Transcript_4724/g.7599 Transcript_4724/m.7599 type:complete len:279 (+) Transcript_4724:160-996(+)